MTALVIRASEAPLSPPPTTCAPPDSTRTPDSNAPCVAITSSRFLSVSGTASSSVSLLGTLR